VRRNIFAATNDDVFNAAGQVQITVCIEKSLVPGTEPPVHKSMRVCFGIIFVPTKYIGSLNGDLASLIGSEMISIFVHDADPEPGANPDRTRLAVARGQGI
jgi:hypothetical protein